MKVEILKSLHDISESIKGIEEHLGEKRDFNFNAYCSDKMQRRAVERELGIIGEGINRIFKVDNTSPISYADAIKNLSNKIIYAYDNIDNTEIWGVIEKNIPILKEEVTNLLKVE